MPRSAEQRNRAKRAIKRAVMQPDRWDHGSFLPSERILAQQFGVSRSTMRLALQDLQNQGFVSHHGGHGWQINQKQSEVNALFIRHRNPHISNLIEQGIRKSLGDTVEFTGVDAPNRPIAEWGEHPPLSVYDPKVHHIIIVFSERGVPQAFADFVKNNGGHIICLGCNLHEDYDTICADFAHMSRALVRHIMERGHRKIAFIGSKNGHTKNPSFAARVIGYQTAMKMYDLEPETVLLNEGFDSLYDDFARWLDGCEAKGNRPTCLYLSGPNYVVRLTRVLEKLGISVPDEMSMAGFGFCKEEGFVNFDRYCTIIEPWNKIGLLAGQTIMSYAATERYMPSLTLVPSRIVQGNSVRTLTTRISANA